MLNPASRRVGRRLGGAVFPEKRVYPKSYSSSLLMDTSGPKYDRLMAKSSSRVFPAAANPPPEHIGCIIASASFFLSSRTRAISLSTPRHVVDILKGHERYRSVHAGVGQRQVNRISSKDATRVLRMGRGSMEDSEGPIDPEHRVTELLHIAGHGLRCSRYRGSIAPVSEQVTGERLDGTAGSRPADRGL
jgi:hypothetical protein